MTAKKGKWILFNAKLLEATYFKLKRIARKEKTTMTAVIERFVNGAK